MRVLSLIVLLLGLLPGAAGAQTRPGDVTAGRRLAMEICAGCHAVAQSQTRPAMDGAPAFLTLARDPVITERGLRAFLQTPHSRMPSVMLTNREMDDVIRYILSMRVNN